MEVKETRSMKPKGVSGEEREREEVVEGESRRER